MRAVFATMPEEHAYHVSDGNTYNRLFDFGRTLGPLRQSELSNGQVLTTVCTVFGHQTTASV